MDAGPKYLFVLLTIATPIAMLLGDKQAGLAFMLWIGAGIWWLHEREKAKREAAEREARWASDQWSEARRAKSDGTP